MREENMPDSKKLRAIIVDDEPPARNKIRELLKSDADVEIIDECSNGREAVHSITTNLPDLVFLDIQMPELDGFGVIEAIGPEQLPAVIFVTAYDQYAVHAFEVHAIDYLLKPFDRQRFQTALNRAKDHLHSNRRDELNQQLNTLLRQLKGPRKQAERFVVKSGGRVFFLKNDEIDWIEAAGNTPAPGNDERHTEETRSSPLHPHPPLDLREHRKNKRAATVVSRRVRGHHAGWNAVDDEQKLS
jgi:two-component system LytT family response regulator